MNPEVAFSQASRFRTAGCLRVSREERRVALQVQRPAGLVVDSLAHGFPSAAVTIEVAVLELHARTLGSLREEPYLDLAREIGVGFNLPIDAFTTI